MLGFWSHLLTDAGAHQARLRLAREQKYLDCSGYLYAARRSLLSPLPEEVLADDAYISHMIWLQGYAIAYAPSSSVKVRYPTNYRDWLLQKVRSTAGATATAALWIKSSEQQKKGAENREATARLPFAIAEWRQAGCRAIEGRRRKPRLRDDRQGARRGIRKCALRAHGGNFQ